MAAPGGKKKGKGKGTTMNLSEFLNKGTPAADGFAVKHANWADLCEQEDESFSAYNSKKIETVALPTAPKAARSNEVDSSRIPLSPPFKVHIGNIPYETTEQEIRDLFQNLQISSIHMPREDGVNGQRLRGFGYVEFREREDLIEALKLNNENLNGRSLRISVPGEHDGDRSGGRRTDDGEANLSNDWRAGRGPLPPRDDVRSGRDGPPRNGFGDRDRSGGFRSGGFEDRGNPRDSERRPDAGGFDTFDRTNRDRAFQRRDDDSFQRGRGGGSGGGFDNDRRSDDRGGYGRREGGGFEDRGNSRGFERRDGGGGGGFSNFQRADDRRERTNDYERGPRRDYNDAPRDSDRPRYGNHDDRATSQREEAPGGEPPKERKRLQLQPRSKPVEVETVASTAIFGGAKPVDTAKKEQEIEAKLHAKHDGKPRDEADSPQGGERVRRTSATSNNSGSNRSRKNSENKDDVERREPRRRFDSDRERDRDYRTSNRGGPRDAGRGPPREFNRGSDRDRYPRDNNFRRDGPREYQRGDREGGPRSDRGDRPPRADSKPIGYVEPVVKNKFSALEPEENGHSDE